MVEVTTDPSVGENDFVALAPGRTIGRYEIVSILGQGGFGITYRARDAQLHREVAIKEYLPSALAVRQDGITVLPRSTKVAEDFTWGRQRFVDEGRTLATLQRAPAIVRVFDFLEANGTAYIVMELVPGKTLEDRLKSGCLTPAELDRILWPLLDGLEQVHATGFLHRDIKPANILLDAQGNPTLIDFGASRAAMAGRSQAMTAIFTPGYAAAEQMTSAKQGPWTDIYGLSATFYHAITGATPPSSFDRMLDDEYKPLGQLLPAGFAPGLLVGIDAGLAVRASDRPQSIAGWRPILGQATMAGAQATMAMTRTADAQATQVIRQPTGTATQTIVSKAAPSVAAPSVAAPPAKSGKGLSIGLAAALVLALAGGGYWAATRPPAVDVAAVQRAEAQKKAAEARRQAEEAELTRLRNEKTQREQTARDEAERQQIEQQLRQKAAADQAAKDQAAAAAKAQADAEEAARQKALELDRAHAAQVETDLHLGPLDRQHVRVALTALGFRTDSTDGVFAQQTRETIAAWQKSRSYPETGFLTGPENQELLKAAAPAISKFDDEQKKKAEEEKAKADAEKAKAAAAAAPPAAAAPRAAPAAPIVAGSPDGPWKGVYKCTPSKGGGPFGMNVQLTLRGGHGVYVVPDTSETMRGNHSLSVSVNGRDVVVSRTYLPTTSNKATTVTGTMIAHFEGGTITGAGPESNSGGRNCTILLTR